MLNGTDKTPALISDYKEYHTDTTVKFVVKMTEEKLAQAEAAGLHKVFKLQTTLTCNSMVIDQIYYECNLAFCKLDFCNWLHDGSSYSKSECVSPCMFAKESRGTFPFL